MLWPWSDNPALFRYSARDSLEMIDDRTKTFSAVDWEISDLHDPGLTLKEGRNRKAVLDPAVRQEPPQVRRCSFTYKNERVIYAARFPAHDLPNPVGYVDGMCMANVPRSRESQRHCTIGAPETDMLDREVVGHLPRDGVGQPQIRTLPRPVPIQNGYCQRHRRSLAHQLSGESAWASTRVAAEIKFVSFRLERQ